MKFIIALMLACMSAAASASDPLTDMSIQRDVIAWHISQGESRDQVRDLVEGYFQVHCLDTGTEFILTRGDGTGITYLLTVRL